MAELEGTEKKGEKKDSWPELLGLPGKEAVEKIKKENPLLEVFVVPQFSVITLDLRSDRVRVWVDQNGKVVCTPRTE